MILINKIGFSHFIERTACQDVARITSDYKLVLDGCSASPQSDVGAKLFAHLFSRNPSVTETFTQLLALYESDNDIINHLLFTIMLTKETPDAFHVRVAGDGVIICQTHDDAFTYETINQNNTPAYYAYNFITPERLNQFREGVSFTTFTYDKTKYKNVGVATDGLTDLLNSSHKEKFEHFLRTNKQNRINLLLNQLQNEAYKHYSGIKMAASPTYLNDDISIAF